MVSSNVSRLPLRDSLIVSKPHTLENERIKGFFQPEVSTTDQWKACRHFSPESVSRVGIHLVIAEVPPLKYPIARGAEYCLTREAVTFFLLIDPAVGGQQIPEVIAGPCTPRKAVIDIQMLLA
jgi:hypothetical protein